MSDISTPYFMMSFVVEKEGLNDKQAMHRSIEQKLVPMEKISSQSSLHCWASYSPSIQTLLVETMAVEERDMQGFLRVGGFRSKKQTVGKTIEGRKDK